MTFALKPSQTLVLSLSGGKDSTATALHLLEIGVLDRHVRAGGEVRRVFLDTGWELDETYRYIDEVLEPRLGRIERAVLWVPGPGEAPPEGYDHLEPLWATPGKTMAADRWALARVFEARLGRYSPFIRLIMHWAMFASRKNKWCTDRLKQKVARGFLAGLPDPVNTVGIRAEESPSRAEAPVVEFATDWDAWIWRPIKHFTREDVIAIHARHGLTPNPLYLHGRGAGRCGCGPCIHSGRNDLRWMIEEQPSRLALLADLEEVVSALELPKWADTGAPTWFQDPTVTGGACMPLADMLAWALSEPRKGGQVAMFPHHEPPGCSIWGLCEVPRADQ